MPTQLPSQIELVTGIMMLFGDTQVESRHINAMITAADNILEEFARPAVRAKSGMGLTAWRTSDDTGLSSEYLADVLSGSGVKRFAYPHDVADYGRCYRLLRAVANLRDKMPLVLPHCAQPWPTLWKHWDELEKVYETGIQLPNDIYTPRYSPFHERLQAIYKEAGIK